MNQHRLAVVGADHLHVIDIVDKLVAVGVESAAHTPDGSLVGLYESWRTDSRATSLAEILDDGRIDIVVTAGIPDERAAVACAAIDAGKWVVSDKPGVTTGPQLDRIRQSLDGRTGRRWTVVFSERLGSRSTKRAIELARDGAIGRIAAVIGSGPHTLAADQRPEWFWDQNRTGGILVDIGSHQIDQFIATIASGRDEMVRVTAAAVGNVSCPDRPAMQDIGAMTIDAPGVRGDHHVDYLTAAGLGRWGDVRLTIVGTEGTLESRANIDVAGRPGGDHLLLVDATGARRVGIDAVRVDWAELLVADIEDDGERLMTQHHPLLVTELAIEAQSMATPWGRTP